MPPYITLLRGINVSGQKKIRMADLKSLYESLGFENAQTYVQSGNVVFDSKEQDVMGLRETIEAQIESTFGFSVPVLIRTGDDVRRVIENHPFELSRTIHLRIKKRSGCWSRSCTNNQRSQSW